MNPVEETARQMIEIYPDLQRVPAMDDCVGCYFYEDTGKCSNYRKGVRSNGLQGTNCTGPKVLGKEAMFIYIKKDTP